MPQKRLMSGISESRPMIRSMNTTGIVDHSLACFYNEKLLTTCLYLFVI